jgi:mannose-6-phosphate isomerase-like protein (cupin superfamily)
MDDNHLTPDAPVVTAADARAFWNMGTLWVLLGEPERTNGSTTVLELTTPVGSGPPPHVHQHSDEWFYVLEGRARFRLGDREVEGGPGAFIFVPRGTAHSFTVIDGPMRKLNVYTPSGPERFTLAVGTPTADLVLPPAGLPRPDPALIEEANRRSDTTPA